MAAIQQNSILCRFPAKIMVDIALEVIRFELLGPPKALIPLLCTSKLVHNALAFNQCHDLFARIFETKFDVDAVLLPEVYTHRMLNGSWEGRMLDPLYIPEPIINANADRDWVRGCICWGGHVGRGDLVSLRNVVIKYDISDIQVLIKTAGMGLMEMVRPPPAFGESNPQITTVVLSMRAPFMDVRDWTLLSWCPWAGTPRDVPYAD